MIKIPVLTRAVLVATCVPILALALLSFSGCGGGGESVTFNGPPTDENGDPITPDRSQMGAAGGGAAPAGDDADDGAPERARPAQNNNNVQLNRGGQRIQRSIGAAGPGGTVPPANTGSTNAGNSGGAVNGAGLSGASEPLISGGLANGLYPQPNPGFSQVGFGGGLNANFTVPVSVPAQPGNGAGAADGFAGASGNSGSTRDVEPVALTLLDRANFAFGEGDEKKAFQYLYAHLLVDDAAIQDYPLEWYSGLAQPRVAFRWGVGIQYNPASNFEGNPPVIGDPENVRIVNAAPASGGRDNRGGSGRTLGPGGGGGGLLGGDGGGGSSRPEDSPYKNLDTRSPQGMLLFYAGDFGDKTLDRLEFRRDNSYYGRLLQMARVEEAAEEAEDAGSEFNRPNPARRSGPPRGGSQRTIGAAGGGRGGGNAAGGAGGFVGDDGANTGGGGGAVGNDAISASSRLQELLGDSVARRPDDNKIGTLYPGVMLIGLATKSELIDRGRELGLDGLLIFNVRVSGSDVPETTTTLRLINLYPQEGQREEVASVNLKHKDVASRREAGRSDPVESALNEIFEQAADRGFRASPMPDLRAEHVEGRVGQLMGETHVDPLRPAVEVVSFFREGLLKEEYAVKALDALLGEGMGDKVLSMNQEERLAAMSRFFPGDDLASTGFGGGSSGASRVSTGAANMAAAPDKPTIGELAPEIESEDLDGVTFKLSDYRGKVVLLDFWGDW
ncbi:MAG: hypothetical protein AAF456_24100 [Planctomycetota bacterium]